MKHYIRALLLILCFSVSLHQAMASSGVLISEVAFNPVGADTGKEYIELYNNSAVDIDISGWDLDADVLPYFTFGEGTVVKANSVLVVYLRASGTNNDSSVFTGAGFGSGNMRSTKGMVALFQSTVHDASTLVDYVQYGGEGDTHEVLAVGAGKWLSQMYVSFVDTEGMSLQRACTMYTVECWSVEQESAGNSLLANEVIPSSSLQLVIGDQIYTGESITVTNPLPVSFLYEGSGSILSFGVDGQIYEVLDNTFSWMPDAYGDYVLEYSLDGEYYDFRYTWEIPSDFVPPDLYISEVLFQSNDAQSDFIEVWIRDAGSLEGKFLEGYSVVVDTTTYDLSTVQALTDSYVVIVLGNNIPLMPPNTQILQDTSSAGLVSTTEQVYIMAQTLTPIHGVCWEGSSVPSNEQQEYSWFVEQSGIWNGKCVSSQGVQKGQSLHFLALDNISHSLDDFSIFPISSPGVWGTENIPVPQPIITVQGSGALSGKAPFGLNVTAENSVSSLSITSYYWDYGDGYVYEGKNPPNHVYLLPGIYTLRLELTDQLGGKSSATQQIHVYKDNTIVTAPKGDDTTTICSQNNDARQHVKISEIYPNPPGVDDGKEWIELHNNSEMEVSLCGLFIDDQQGGSSPYDLSGVMMEPHQFLVLYATTTKIALGNAADSVRLLQGNFVLHEVSYTQAPEGKSYSVFYNKNLL